MAKSPNVVTVTFYPPKPVNAQLAKMAEENRRSKAAQVLVIVEAYFARLNAEQAEKELNGLTVQA